MPAGAIASSSVRLALVGALLLLHPASPGAEAAPAAATPSRVDRAVTDMTAASSTLPQPGAFTPSAPPTSGEQSAATEDEWVVAPLPIANPTIGAGLAVAAIYSFRPFDDDPESNASTLGLGGFYTDSESWAFGGGIKTSLAADSWRIKAVGATADLNYDLYGAGGSASTRLPVHQTGSGGSLEVQRATLRDLFVGLFVAYGSTEFVPRDGSPPPPGVTPNEMDATIATLGLHLEGDHRDNQYYPTQGYRAEYRYAGQSPDLGSDFDYRKQTASFNDYTRAFGGVIASRVFLCQADGDVPFFDQCLYGSGGDLRGYETGRYWDEAMFAMQVEYRRELSGRWGATAFVGTGQVMPDLGAFGSSQALPAAGVGLRWNAAPDNHINLRVDYAYGVDGGSLYISIGEAY